MPRTYTISRLAAAAGVNVETIRYYQRRRLMPEPTKPLRGNRLYTESDARQLRFIRRAQGMGFALSEVEDLLDLRARGSCGATRALARSKIHSIEERIRDLRELRNELRDLVSECDRNGDDSTCPILDRLASDDASQSL